MSERAAQEQRRTVLSRLLGELYVVLSAANGKIEELEIEYDLTLDHANKLEENLTFLKKEAQVVKLKEYKSAVESYRFTMSSLQSILADLESARADCKRNLKQADSLMVEIKNIDEFLENGAKVYEFPNDKRRNQDAD